MRRHRFPLDRLLAAMAVATGLVLTACSGGGGGGDGKAAAGDATTCHADGGIDSASTTPTPMTVDLEEWTVSPAPLAVAAGPVRVTARNRGTEKHEVVVVRAPIDRLPVADGAVDEEGLPAGALVGEIEAFDAGGTCTTTFDLSPGTYSFFCNVVETEADGTRESHFEKGMVSAVTVG
ncbi:MAG: hypothetical protein QOI56_602 [Actinomycetota bacterium]|nr:hypothetical protein [Actinomycetota bacterium]